MRSKLSKQDATLALMQVPGIGKILYSRLVERFSSPQEVWNSSASDLQSIKSLPPKAIKNILEGPDIEAVERLKKRLDLMDGWFLTMHDAEFPPNLLNISQVPPVLFGLGEKDVLGLKSVAIVGSRKASTYGKRVAREIASGLCQRGWTVVSGLALGIDSAAHEGALSGGGPTVAVKGCGLDVVYPARNRELEAKIAENGAVITEFFPGTQPEPGNFPTRNRIISGLGRAIIVVEAGPKSGSLITAYLGMEQGKDIMAVPGNIYSYNSIGCHELIRQGAALVSSIEEIMEELGEFFFEKGFAQSQDTVKVSSLSEDEQCVVDKLEAEPQHIDDIAAHCGLPVALVNSLLVRLELKGLVVSQPGSKYSIR